VADPKAIDDAMKLGTNYPKGPLAWADEIGLDIVYELLAGLSLEYGEPRYRPCPLLRRYVNAGYYGKEGLGGFYAIAALAGKV
jgi:3-hydroxybutyryl-CoA dehydrogenase